MNVSITAAVQAAGLFTPLVIVMALSGKLIGGFIGSRNRGFRLIQQFDLWCRCDAEGRHRTVVMSDGRNMGVIGDEIFSAIVLMVAVSVIVSPVLLKFAIKVKETRTTPEPTSLST